MPRQRDAARMSQHPMSLRPAEKPSTEPQPGETAVRMAQELRGQVLQWTIRPDDLIWTVKRDGRRRFRGRRILKQIAHLVAVRTLEDQLPVTHAQLDDRQRRSVPAS